MNNKAVILLATGLEDLEKVSVAYLVAVGAAELNGTVPMWESIGDGATTFSY